MCKTCYKNIIDCIVFNLFNKLMKRKDKQIWKSIVSDRRN